MNILFVDDSIQYKQYVGVGGVILHDDKINSLCTLFKQKKQVHHIPIEEEIKWSPDKDSWVVKNLTGDNRISAYSDILDLLKKFNSKTLVAVFQGMGKKLNTKEAKWKCIKFITERFQFYLQGQEDKNGIIIADFPGSGKEEKELLQKYFQLKENGTGYVKPENIVMNLLTTESHLNPALQLADLVVGITTGMCTPQRVNASHYWEIIKRSFYCNQQGQVIGCGLKVYPKEMVEKILPIMFPEVIEETEKLEESYEEYVERMRYLYSVLMSKEELDLHFPRP